MPASYARIVISEPTVFGAGVRVYDGHLEADGCTEWLALSAGDYVFALETTLQRGMLDVDVQFDTDDVYGYSEGTMRVPPASGATLHRSTFRDDRAQRVAAMFSHALQLADLPFRDGTFEAFADAPCNFTSTTIAACGRASSLFVGDNNRFEDLSRKRHVVGHGIGHAVQTRAVGSLATNWTSGDSSDAACNCSHVTISNRTHCLQSREQISFAFAEGFAHFIAVRLFNDNASSFCRFNHYKEFREDSGATVMPPYRVNCGFPIRWMAEHGCDAPDTGVEYDWMNFLWTINRPGAGGLTLDEFFEVLADGCVGAGDRCSGDPLYWSNLEVAVDTSGLNHTQKTNFKFAAELFSVNH